MIDFKLIAKGRDGPTAGRAGVQCLKELPPVRLLADSAPVEPQKYRVFVFAEQLAAGPPWPGKTARLRMTIGSGFTRQAGKRRRSLRGGAKGRRSLLNPSMSEVIVVPLFWTLGVVSPFVDGTRRVPNTR